MPSEKKEKMVAFSSYCSGLGLSVPSSFDLNSVIESLSDDDYSISGYKFKKSVLDKIVPSLKFKKSKKMHKLDKILYVFRFHETSTFMLVNQDSKTDFDDEVSAIVDGVHLEKIKVYGSRSSGAEIIDALTLLEDNVFKTGVNKSFHDTIDSPRTKFYIGSTNGSDVLSMILEEKTELEFHENELQSTEKE